MALSLPETSSCHCSLGWTKLIGFVSSLANFEGIKATGVKAESGSGINEYVKQLFDQSLSWDDVIWLKR
jgi:hypothetical protein